jgi:hypothetical protein
MLNINKLIARGAPNPGAGQTRVTLSWTDGKKSRY